CAPQELSGFTLDQVAFEDGKGKCPYDPTKGHTGLIVGVARVCKGDVGGARTLQKKWTTFLKARLVCSATEQQLNFNRLPAVFHLPGADTAFFGVFQARWGDVDVSAICRYHILEVKKAFEGPYKEYREQAQKWGRYSDEVPSPRPGA
ncbi:Semaphorin-4C, partial [Fulmarus glacialis]